ncbi:MAG: acetate--CoA ligase family protein [Smithella sp.]
MESKDSLDAVFKPKGIAMIGASGSPGKLGYDILYNLINAGFEGSIFPINPKADQILGLPVFKDIASIPTPPELAVIVIPSGMVVGAIEECGKAGVKAAIIITGGFAESGHEGEILQQELEQTARKAGVRLIGPNCQGVNYPYNNLCGSWPLIKTRGKIAFLSQSGTVGAALIDWASEEHLGFSVFVSLGNRADIDESDCIEYFNNDPNTQVIALYIEGIKRPRIFQKVLAKTTKPIVILKAGRTERGRIAAQSHTKSMAGTDAVYDAIFKKYKVYRADNLEELYDFAKALAYMEKPSGRKLLNISSSGGAAILAIDEGEKLGFENPAPSKALQERLRKILPPHCGVSNPIDLTGDAMSNPGLYSKVIAEAKSDYDASVVIFGDPISGASETVTGKGELIIFCGGADVERQESKLMHEKGIPVFPTPERGIKAFYQLLRFEPEGSTVKNIIQPLPAAALTLMDVEKSVALLQKYQIPAVPAILTGSAAEAVKFAKKIGEPVVLKIASGDVPHKSDVGGVFLNLEKPAQIRESYTSILENVKKKLPKANIEGITVSPMAKPGSMEVILGVISDPQYGPALMFGLGGIFTEIYRDVQFCLLPATEKDFRQMIRAVRGYQLISGVRGQKPKDEKALIAIMKGISRLVKDNPEIDQIDLNPVLLYEKGASIVDYKIYTR